MKKQLTFTEKAEMIALEIRLYYRENKEVIDPSIASERLSHEGKTKLYTCPVSLFSNWYCNASMEEIEKVERKAVRINQKRGF